MAKLVARKTQLPTYVGSSISFTNTGMGGTVEEEMEAFRKLVELVLGKLDPVIKRANTAPNGTRHDSA
jgi:hypothetical protein